MTKKRTCGEEGCNCTDLKRPEPSVVECAKCGWRREHGVVIRRGTHKRDPQRVVLKKLRAMSREKEAQRRDDV